MSRVPVTEPGSVPATIRCDPAFQRGAELGVGLMALIDAAQVEVVTHRSIP